MPESTYSLKQWAKASLIFAGTIATFLALKTTGSFTVFNAWFRGSAENKMSADNAALQHSQRSPTELFPAVIELSNFTGATGFKLDGEAADDRSGISVASAGDINGDDSIDDLIVGAYYANPSGRTNAGRSYVVFGQSSQSLSSETSSSMNDAPVLVNNNLLIDQDQTIILTTNLLSATDIDSDDISLTFTMSNIQHGRFEYVDNPGIAITSFTQQDVIDGNVQFVRDGSDYLPVYEVSVSDGTSATEPAPVTITFSGVNNVPTLITNELPLYQGQTVTITQGMLYARDVENEPPDLLFVISDIQYGHFERTGNLGTAITRFTQQEINDGEILFIHDGSNTAPHFYVSVTDYTYTTTPELCNSQLLDVNDAPRFINNQLEVYQGQTVVITPEMLKAGDPDNNDPDLVFTITDLQHGQFEEFSNPGIAITSFTQQNIIDGQIQFVQDGSSNTPSYTVTVSDGELSTSSAAIVIGMERIALVKNRLIISDSLQAVLSEAFLKATHVTEDDKSFRSISKSNACNRR